jgi:hypothetical protein
MRERATLPAPGVSVRHAKAFFLVECGVDREVHATAGQEAGATYIVNPKRRVGVARLPGLKGEIWVTRPAFLALGAGHPPSITCGLICPGR